MRLRLKQQRLVDFIVASRLSQNHWALKVGLSRGHWSAIVNGKHPYPSPKTRALMLDALGLPVEELFEVESGTPSWAGGDFRRAIADRYLIDTELGQGGMGAVYLARDVRHGRTVAVKVISPEAVSGIGLAQFQREIATVARLHHANVLPLYDSGEAAGHPFFVMPWVRGGSLRGRLAAERRLDLPTTLRLTRGIAAALRYAHDEHVLHCDIKPENVLLEDDHAWVTDFGIARTLHAEALDWRARTELDFSAGTPAYVSPEQASGEQALDARSDVYSLGCMVFEMLSGRTPFEGTSTREIVSRRFIVPPPPLRDFAPEVPRAVAETIERAMALPRERRPDSAVAMADELEQAAAGASRLFAGVSLAATRLAGRLRRARGQTTTAPGGMMGRMGRWVESLAQDLTLALRQFRRQPGFTAIEAVIFALAIGLTTSVFAAVNNVLLQPLPFPDADRLVNLQGADSSGNKVFTVSAANWYDWQRQNRTMDGIAIYKTMRLPVASGDVATYVDAAQVSPDFPSVLRPRLLFGRTFTADQASAPVREALVSEGFWRRMLGARHDDSLALTVIGNEYRVIGVVAAGQAFPEGTEIWIPYRHRQAGGDARNWINWIAVGRMRQGVTPAQAQADLDLVARRIREGDPAGLYSYGVPLTLLQDWLVGPTAEYLVMLMGAVVLLLLIACSNLAGANLARGLARQREMAVRAALGGGRGRLTQLLLVERFTVALLGGAAGVALAVVLTGLLRRHAPDQLSRAAEIHVDGWVVLFAFVTAAVAGLLAGALPARMASGARLSSAMASGGRGAARGWRGTPGRALVAAEIALSVALVAGMGLLVQSFRTLLARPLGFDPRGVMLATITLGGPRYSGQPANVAAFWRDLLDGLRADGRVASAGLANWVPLGTGGTSFIEVAGRDEPNAGAGYRVIGDGYLEALGVPRVRGRLFSAADDSTAPRVAVINQAMAEAYWPGQDPVGRLVRTPGMESGPGGAPPPWLTVVGVVGNVRHWGYITDMRPEIYVPWQQVPSWATSLTVVVRGRGTAEELGAVIRARVSRLDPRIAADIEPLERRAERAVATRRFTMDVLGVFGVLALGLAVIGVYGVLSLSVAQRGRELAVRAALGADRSRLLALVLRGGLQVVGAGAAAGLAGAFFATQLLRSQLVDTSPRDPRVLGVTMVVIIGAGMLAALLPALRATRTEPAAALQAE